MNRLVLLLTPLVVVAAFVSLFSKGESKPPPRIARLALAVALYSALTAIEWFFCLKDNGYLIVEWKDFVLWPFFDLPDFVRSVGTPLSSGSGWRMFRIAADLATVVPWMMLPFWLIWIGVRRQAGRWLPFLLFGVLLFHFEGCCNAGSGI